jgi:hypothetical protein
MILHQVSLDDAALPLLREFPEDPAQFFPKLHIQGLSAILWDENKVVLALPSCMI